MSPVPHSAFPYRYSGGSLDAEDPTYVVRSTDRDFYNALKAGEFCYVLNSRQMGKSSLRVRTMHRLQREGVACAEIDLTGIISSQTTPQRWYADLIAELVSGFQLQIDRRKWWRDRNDLTPVHGFEMFLENVLLAQVRQRIVIFVDEIDSVLRLSFPVDDFFALIRACYNKRADRPQYRRLTWALLGVATPSDLMRDPHAAPFNIGRAIELKGFQLSESSVLAAGFAQKADRPQEVLAEVLRWTGGQPFLTQRLCWQVAQTTQSIPEGEERSQVEEIVRQRAIVNWESQDDPPHLKTIRDRLLHDADRGKRLLLLYERILRRGTIAAKNAPDYWELQLSGLVVRQQGALKVYNPIYQAVFHLHWVRTQLQRLQPEYPMLSARTVGVVSVVVTLGVMAVRSLGMLQVWELPAFDFLVRQLPPEPPDNRLFIVAADERDLNRYGYPLPDAVLARLLDKLQSAQPAAIGLDIVRDLPVPPGDVRGYAALAAHFQRNDKLVAVCAFGGNPQDSIAPPPRSREFQVGFVDLYDDRPFDPQNNTVRRYLLSRTPNPDDPASACTTPYSLGWQLAYLYLDARGIPVETADKDWKFGDRVVKRLEPRSSGYQALDARGNQLLVHYRRTRDRQSIAQQVAIRDILTEGKSFNPAWVKDRVVLVGVTASSVRDFYETPNGEMRGLSVHAHVVSQLIGAVEDDRPLWWWWSGWVEALWIGVWSFAFGIGVWWWKKTLYRGLTAVVIPMLLCGCCGWFLAQGGWIPLIPPMLAMAIVGGVLRIYSIFKVQNKC